MRVCACVCRLSMMGVLQVAISFVTRLKLGGKSYAPADDYALNKYVYGLSELVDMINKIQSTMEDAMDSSDCVPIIGRMLRVVKLAMLQDVSSRFKKKHVEFSHEKIMANLRRILLHDLVKVGGEIGNVIVMEGDDGLRGGIGLVCLF